MPVKLKAHSPLLEYLRYILFETASLNIPTKYGVLQDIAVEQIGAKLDGGGQGSGRLLRQMLLFIQFPGPQQIRISDDSRQRSLQFMGKSGNKVLPMPRSI